MILCLFIFILHFLGSYDDSNSTLFFNLNSFSTLSKYQKKIEINALDARKEVERTFNLISVFRHRKRYLEKYTLDLQ